MDYIFKLLICGNFKNSSVSPKTNTSGTHRPNLGVRQGQPPIGALLSCAMQQMRCFTLGRFFDGPISVLVGWEYNEVLEAFT